MESQHSAGVPTCHDFLRFVIVSEKSRPEVGNRWLRSSQNGGFLVKKRPPYGQIFTNVFQMPHRTRKHVFLCKFREIWRTGSRWNCALFNGQKKNFGSLCHCRLCADRAQNLSGTAPNNRLGVPKFHPNRFTSGGVIASSSSNEKKEWVTQTVREAATPFTSWFCGKRNWPVGGLDIEIWLS